MINKQYTFCMYQKASRNRQGHSAWKSEDYAKITQIFKSLIPICISGLINIYNLPLKYQLIHYLPIPEKDLIYMLI